MSSKEAVIAAINRKHQRLILSILIVIGIGYFLSSYHGISKVTLQLDRILQLIVVIWTTIAVYLAYGIFKRGLANLRIKQIVDMDRLHNYQKALHHCWLLIGLPFLFTTISYVVTENGAFLFVMIVQWVLVALTAPNKQLIELLIK